jgi:hypothetical protein
MSFSEGSDNPGLVQGRLDSTEGTHGGIYWACVLLGYACLLVRPTEQKAIAFLPSMGNIVFSSLKETWSHSHHQAWWEVQELFAPYLNRSPGTQNVEDYTQTGICFLAI